MEPVKIAFLEHPRADPFQSNSVARHVRSAVTPNKARPQGGVTFGVSRRAARNTINRNSTVYSFCTGGDGRASRWATCHKCQNEVHFDILFSEGTPSEAEGKYGDHEFSFYARFNWWGFAITPLGGTPASMMIDVEETKPNARPEQFDESVLADFGKSFVIINNEYGAGEFAASYMPESEMRLIIESCIDRFETWRLQNI